MARYPSEGIFQQELLSSALMPLCVHESTTRQTHTQLRKFLQVVWWGSLVEVHRATARLHRLGQLTEAREQKALSQLDLLNCGWREILPGDPAGS